MARRTTPVKPPNKAERTIAMGALPKGKTTPRKTQTLAGRIGAEAAATKKKRR